MAGDMPRGRRRTLELFGFSVAKIITIFIIAIVIFGPDTVA
jgi:hypothetical protein